MSLNLASRHGNRAGGGFFVAMTESQALVQWAPLIEATAIRNARRFEALGWDGDDVRSVAMIAVVKAVRTYDPTRNASLNTWVHGCIRSEVLTAWREANKQCGGSRDRLGQPSIFLREDYDAPAPDTLEAIADRFEQEEQRAYIKSVLPCLSAREKYLLKRTVEGEKRTNIARELGISDRRIFQMWRTVLEIFENGPRLRSPNLA